LLRKGLDLGWSPLPLISCKVFLIWSLGGDFRFAATICAVIASVGEVFYELACQLLRLVLPDGPAARGAGTSCRVIRFAVVLPVVAR